MVGVNYSQGRGGVGTGRQVEQAVRAFALKRITNKKKNNNRKSKHNSLSSKHQKKLGKR